MTTVFNFHFSIVCLVLLSSCGSHSQGPVPDFIPEDTIKVVFDVDKFKKSTKPDYPYLEFTENGVYVEQSLQDDFYLEEKYYPDSLLGDYNEYYLSGKMMTKCQFFIKGDFLTGRKVCFDELGNITSVEDLEAPYAFSLDDVLAYMEKEGINIQYRRTQLWRAQKGANDIYGFPEGIYVWLILYALPDGKGRYLTLDGQTGEILQERLLDRISNE